jgi:hypothetical protein
VGLVQSAKTKGRFLIHGDMQSGTIHAFFIHYAHIWGCHLYQQFRCDFVLLFLQSIYVYMAVESLSTIKEKQNPILLHSSTPDAFRRCNFTPTTWILG